MAEAGSSPVVDRDWVVATREDHFFSEIVEAEICHSGLVPGGRGVAEGAKVFTWREMRTWVEARSTLQALGFDDAAADDWAVVGLDKEAMILTADDLERRRRIVKTVLSAGRAHGWTLEDEGEGQKFMKTVEKALGTCHDELPMAMKKMGKKKSGKEQVPIWQEPSTLIVEYGLSIQPHATVALHLSNLQRMPMASLCTTSGMHGGGPGVMGIQEARELYTKLSQSQVKVEEALNKFGGGRLMIWAPESNEQIPRIMNALQKLYTDRGVLVQVILLVPYNPLPRCRTPSSILDLWGHQLLQPKYNNMVGEICFIQEASRCVFTRANSPIHIIKNVAAVSVQANAGESRSVVKSMRSMLVEEVPKGDRILIEIPAKNATILWQRLNAIGQAAKTAQITWQLQVRSRGHTNVYPMSNLAGHVDRGSEVEIRARVQWIKSEFGDPNMLIGRESLFNDPDSIIAEGSLEQFIALSPMVEECVLVSPHKALFTPKAGAEAFSRALTDSDLLRTINLRYRRSGPLGGAIFARPKALASHVAAERHNAFISRLPKNEAALLKLEAHIEVLGIDGSNHGDIPAKIMDKIAQETKTPLTESQDFVGALGVGEWRKILKDDSWSGKILLQCRTTEDMYILYDNVHGRGLCIDGVIRTLEVTSRSDVFLASGRLAHKPASAPAS